VAEEKEHETRQWISDSEAVQLGVDDIVVPADALSAQYLPRLCFSTTSSTFLSYSAAGLACCCCCCCGGVCVLDAG
jgi:hypothetical protein